MQRVDQLLEDVAAEDVSFQLHYSAQELRSLMATCLAGPDRKLGVMRDRVAKHLGSGSPLLLREVWSRCVCVLSKGTGLDRWGCPLWGSCI